MEGPLRHHTSSPVENDYYLLLTVTAHQKWHRSFFKEPPYFHFDELVVPRIGAPAS